MVAAVVCWLSLVPLRIGFAHRRLVAGLGAAPKPAFYRDNRDPRRATDNKLVWIRQDRTLTMGTGLRLRDCTVQVRARRTHELAVRFETERAPVGREIL